MRLIWGWGIFFSPLRVLVETVTTRMVVLLDIKRDDAAVRRKFWRV
jgi:hypothetical protein